MSLLHSVFLIMCACSICNFGISWKMPCSDEHGVCSRVYVILGANAIRTAEMLHVAFQGQTVDRTQPLNGFPSLKVV